MSGDLATSEQATAAAAAEKANADGVTKPARHDRPSLVAYACDAETEAALREGLSEDTGASLDIRRGGIRGAIAAMRKTATPRTLIIDIGGEAQPLTALSGLADVLEPDVQVLAIGDRSDLDFYRQITRGVGCADYLAKPLTREMVLRHFAPLVSGRAAEPGATRGGHFLAVTGTRGGAGATTVASYLAWHFAVDRRQHTALLDVDLHRGNTAMLLGVRITGGLRTALETPERVDELFIERTAQILDNNPAADRLSVLASEERLSEPLFYEPGAAARLMRMMQRRYAVIVGDVPLWQAPHVVDFMGLAQRRILVMEPTIVSMRDTLRLLAMPTTSTPTQRPIIVLNKADQHGGLTRKQVADGLGVIPDVVIPDVSKQLGTAATLGLPLTAMRGRFRDAILELAGYAAFERLLDSPTLLKGGIWRRRQSDASRQSEQPPQGGPPQSEKTKARGKIIRFGRKS